MLWVTLAPKSSEKCPIDCSPARKDAEQYPRIISTVSESTVMQLVPKLFLPCTITLTHLESVNLLLRFPVLLRREEKFS
jgi:hypothetical protein